MENPTPQKNNRTVVILLAVIVVLLVAVLGMFMLKGNAAEESTPKLGYATEGITAVNDEDELAKALKEAYENMGKNSMALSYQRTAYSSDGQNFDCYVANAEGNHYDMYIGIYADETFEDQLFLSGLIRPGEAFERITLDRKLKAGSNEVYVTYTQVEEDLQTIHGQTVVKMNFMVR